MAQHRNSKQEKQSTGIRQEKTHKPHKALRYWWHRIKFTIAYDHRAARQYKPSQLYTVLNRLLNGGETLSGISNKEWFAARFDGGMTRIAIEQQEVEEGFIIHYFLVCYNKHQTLSKEVKNGLIARFHSIAPLGTVHFEEPSPTPIKDHFEIAAEVFNLMLLDSEVDPDSEVYQSLGAPFHQFCTRVMSDEGEGFGGILQLARDFKKSG